MPQDIKLQKAEDGKGLSTNDYTAEDKAKVDAIPADPKYTDTVYTHPASHPASMITESTSRRFVSDTEKSTWNSKLGSVGTTTVTGVAVINAGGSTSGIPNGTIIFELEE